MDGTWAVGKHLALHAYDKLCRVVAILGCSGIALAGCKKSWEQVKTSKQVIAQVGEQVITTQELENEFRLATSPPRFSSLISTTSEAGCPSGNLLGFARQTRSNPKKKRRFPEGGRMP